MKTVREQLPHTDRELKEVTIEAFMGDLHLTHPNHPPYIVKRLPGMRWEVIKMTPYKLRG